ncbi:MAG: shikimate kinase [Sphaerochaeta sp.]|jgi:shikimate kinase|nr:shikimate kinase [Sphaerochaeta sp.]
MRSHLYLSGIKHSGKTTMAALIAGQLALAWADLDNLVAAQLAPGETVRSFYRERGQDAFQALEREALERLLASATERMVIALGGGACDNEKLMERVKGSGTLVYLKVSEEVLLTRILRGGIPPFLDQDDPAGSFHILYKRRDERYSKMCDLLVELPDGLDARGSSDLVLSRLAEEA